MYRKRDVLKAVNCMVSCVFKQQMSNPNRLKS